LLKLIFNLNININIYSQTKLHVFGILSTLVDIADNNR